MSLRLYRELVARARHFLKVSEFDVSEERYDIALPPRAGSPASNQGVPSKRAGRLPPNTQPT